MPFPGAPSYLSNRAIWLGPYTTALHLYVCSTCPDLFSTIWPCSPLVYSDVPSSSPQLSSLCLALGCHLQTLLSSHNQSSSTLGRPQLQAKPFLLLLTQRRSSHLPLPRRKSDTFLHIVCKAKGEHYRVCFWSEGRSGSSEDGLRDQRGAGCPREGINRLLQQDQKGGHRWGFLHKGRRV